MKKFLIAAAAACLVLVSFSILKKKAPEPIVEKESYNLILISIDTVRNDFLELYNLQGAPTPHLNRIAKKAHLFTGVISQAPYTLPSHCSMLTGTYPMKHQVQENTASKLTEQALTLAEVLKANHYNTAGFVGSVVLGADTGIQQGFDFYDDSFSHHNVKTEDAGGVQKEAGMVLRSFERWFQARDTGKFFAFIHFYDAHKPYEPPAPFMPDSKAETDRYKGELRYVDSVIGDLHDTLERQGIWDHTILVITGDHGEMFGEHGENGHGYFIYQEAVRVPLLIAIPNNIQETIVKDVVQVVDLMPTILEVLGISIPDQVQGTSFAALLSQKSIPNRFAFSESLTATRYFGTAPLQSIQDATYKYIDNARPELYNIQVDPRETSNLYDQQKEVAGRLKGELNGIVRRFAETSKNNDSERKLSAEEEEQLASLGYISLKDRSSPVHSSHDAKDFIQSWSDLNKIGSLLDAGKYNETLLLTQRLQETGSVAIELRVFEARAHDGLGKPEKAVTILKQVTAEDPENAQAWMALAYSLRKTGDVDSAIAIYRNLMDKEDSLLGFQNYARILIRLNRKEELLTYLKKNEGKFTDRHNEALGEIYLNLRQYDEARHYLEKAIVTHPDSPSTYINYSALLAVQGKVTQAVALLEENRSRFSNADYLLQLGRVYNQSQQAEKELQVFKTMVETFPTDPRGYFFLARMLLEHKGDPQTVIQLAERGLRLEPSVEFEPFGYFLLGDAYTALGMKDKAKYYLNRAEKARAENSTP